jgi:hypothetical protein
MRRAKIFICVASSKTVIAAKTNTTHVPVPEVAKITGSKSAMTAEGATVPSD